MAIRNLILHITAVLSALTQAGLFGILITIAVVELPIERLRPFVLAASTLNGVLLVALLAIVARILTDSASTSLEHLLISLSFTLSTTALVLSFYVLASVWAIYKFKASDLNSSVTACLVITGLVLCSITLITQLLVHLLLLFPRQQQDNDFLPTSSPKRFSLNLRSFASSPPSKTQPYSPSINSLHSLKSSKQGSMNQVFGPLGSKTRLLITHSLHNGDSQSQLSRPESILEISCRGEMAALASAEPYELSSSPASRMNLPRTMLETIPGSRPVSPAKPLEPYLWDEISPEDFPLPESPSLSRATSPIHSGSPTDHHLPFPPMIGEYASSSQTHIHPLFRSDSPVPPPTPTPGTKVTASPYAGQVVGSDHALVKKLKSRPTTPARSPVESVEKFEVVPNFSRPGALNRNGGQPMEMF